MPKNLNAEELASQARFVFKGTVQKLKASTLPDLKDTARTVIVKVDQIVQAPQELSYFAGHDITVQLATGEKVKVGEELLFYTNGWLFGESIAVVSLGSHAVEAAPATMTVAMSVADPVKSFHNQVTRERYENADLVVTGRVSAVRLPTEGLSAVASASDPLTPSSEHDPVWHEAVVDVAAVHKGDAGQQNVTLRFPSSEDVMWFRAPKFRPGDEGVFMLQKGQIKEHAANAAAAGTIETTEAYTAFHPVDFQPLSHLQSDAASALVSLLSNPENKPE